ncbi:MAG: tetratricopeptide repeat protein [Gemmatimonadetes bacterium]|nr:tetratricopeptide repeat protein [Gemmatimonadota bacterium]
MIRRAAVLPVLLSLLALGAAHPVIAQGGALAQGTEALRTGRYDDAVRLLRAATTSGGPADRTRAVRGLARALAVTGRHDDALAALDRAVAADIPAAEVGTTRGRILRAVGRDADAERAFDAAVDGGASDVVEARLERALLWWDRGERDRAAAALDGFIDLYNQGRARTAAELTAVGTAVRRLGVREPDLFHDAVRAYDEAIAADPGAVEPRIRMAELFLATYDGGEAQKLLTEALAIDPRRPDALLAMARAKRFEGSAEAAERVDQALEVNPRHAEALAFRGLLLIEAGDDAGAIEAAEAALEVNPRLIDALAVRGAARYLSGEERGHAADLAAARRLDPHAGRFLTTGAELAARRGRYQDAVALAERGVALDSVAWDAWSLLGMNQLRAGRIEDARRTLERAFAGDPFNVWTKNTLDLMDRLAGFVVRSTPRFRLVLHPDEADLLEPYVAAVAEEAYAALSERYGYRPVTPVRVEVYPSHADFSVRTMGMPGLGALGVAFGNVLAMDSPSARDVGGFHWGSTLWHEIAHAVTLGMTRHRVPRWLTEGISVREERRSRPGWGGGVGLDLLAAFRADRLLPLRDIDEGFIRPSYPGQVQVSYAHAGLLVELIERDHGTPAVRKLLEAYADGLSTEAALRRALGTGPDAVDDLLADHLRSRYAAALDAVEELAAEAGRRDTRDPEALAASARARPDDLAAQLAAGQALVRAGRGARAEPFLERARALFPDMTGPGSPDALLAEIRLAGGDTAGAAEALQRLTTRDETALAANLQLAAVLERSDPASAAAALDRAIHIHPFDPETHRRLAELAVALDRPQLEVRERRALVALRPVDRAGALYRLALAQRRAGDSAGARRSVMAALEIAPAFAEAQDLLLDLSGGDS